MSKQLIIGYLIKYKKTISNGFFSLCVKAAGLIAAIFLSLFIAKNFGSEGLGVVNFAMRIGALTTMISLFGFNTLLIKIYSDPGIEAIQKTKYLGKTKSISYLILFILLSE